MNTENKTMITVEAEVNAPVSTVWNSWNNPEHITKWNSASDDWHTPHATSDLRPGGTFTSRMEARDGSMGFDFTGTYDDVRPNEFLSYTMADGRTAAVTFTSRGNTTHVSETFQAENENSHEMQKMGWQSILDNFKRYTEKL